MKEHKLEDFATKTQRHEEREGLLLLVFVTRNAVGEEKT